MKSALHTVSLGLLSLSSGIPEFYVRGLAPDRPAHKPTANDLARLDAAQAKRARKAARKRP